MTRRTVPGYLDLEAMRLLHAEPHLLALADAHDRLRQAVAALRACEHPNGVVAARLGVVHAVLVDQLAELERLRQ
jgi:hypothetical protein